MNPARPWPRLALPAALLLSACARQPADFLPQPIHPAKSEAKTQASQPPTQSGQERPKTMSTAPTPTPPQEPAPPPPRAPAPAPKHEAADITLNFDQERLPTLIQLIYGTILKKNYTLDPAIASRTDLVTLRTGPQTPTQIEQTARLLLKSYGVAVLELGPGTYRIVPDTNLQGYAPEIRRGRALPQVPLPLRPVFQLVELQAVRYTDVSRWLRSLFPGDKLTVSDDTGRNAIMLSGLPDDVAAAMEALRLLDRPAMKGRHSARINPVFLSVDEMAKRLAEVLAAEGYSAGTSPQENAPVTFIPILGINAILAFAADDAILDHALDWARALDQPAHQSGEGFFTYQVRNTDAQRLAETLRDALGAAATSSASASAAPAAAPGGGPAGSPVQQPASTTSGGKKITVNSATNTIIFKGSNEEYTRLYSLIEKLDMPAKAALIEVTVAEVDLNEHYELGVDNLNTDMLKSGALQAVTGGGGFILNYVNGDQTLKAIHALASKNHAKVLSSPRLMARNGETASIQVGQQVPIVTSQLGSAASSGFGNNSNLLTSVQYKDVGVILKVKPVIYSGDRIELEVAQEVSDATSTSTGVSTSPTINTKKVETRLALKDGSTIMLGGLISNSVKAGNSGVPWLKDLPWVGQLFRLNNEDTVQQELIVLITPYTILDDHDAQSITEAFRNQIGPWASPGGDKAPSMPVGGLKPAPRSQPPEAMPN